MLIDGLELCCGLILFNFIIYFLADWTDILMAPIHCKGSIGEQIIFC